MKNYTTIVPAEKSINNIKKMLVKAGATAITETYGSTKQITAISFVLMVDLQPLHFKLPAKVESIYKKMIKTYKKPTEKSHKDSLDQACRTAWKTIAEWVQIQLDMIEEEQADVVQLLMPYMTDGQQSYYEKWKENKFKMLN